MWCGSSIPLSIDLLKTYAKCPCLTLGDHLIAYRKENAVLFLTMRKRIGLVSFIVGCILVSHTTGRGGAAGARQTQEGSETPQFGSDYEDLTPQQKALVDDLYHRFSEVTGRELKPEEAYGQARLSERTTFEAVTHALSTTLLSDENGNSLGTALDLIEHLETVNGKIKGAPGDHQFRL
jgi:hypothetical protein